MPDVDLSTELRGFQVEPRLLVADYSESDRSNAGFRRAPVHGGVATGSPPDSTSRAPVVQIAVTMLICFIAAFGVMYWQRRSESPANPQQGPEETARPFSPTRSIAQPMPVPQPAAVIVNSANAAVPAMPVSVSFLQYNRRSDEDDPDKTTSTFVGRIWNRSAAPIMVDVVRASATGQSTAQAHLTVDARRVSAFGQNDGVELHPGDTVTLRSDRFADLVVQVH
jgi:hypothetical protein